MTLLRWRVRRGACTGIGGPVSGERRTRQLWRTRRTRTGRACRSIGETADAYRIRRDSLRSASTLPPVWQFGQYVTSCDSYDTRRRSSPHTGHGSPYRL